MYRVRAISGRDWYCNGALCNVVQEPCNWPLQGRELVQANKAAGAAAANKYLDNNKLI